MAWPIGHCAARPVLLCRTSGWALARLPNFAMGGPLEMLPVSDSKSVVPVGRVVWVPIEMRGMYRADACKSLQCNATAGCDD